METKQPRYTSWETIQKEHPDKFVLLENPVFATRPHLKEAILLYEHKSQKKVIEKSLELKPYYLFITPHYKWNRIIADYDDNKFVDCAFMSGADYIVTNDKHFNILKIIDFPKILKSATNFF